MADQVGGAADDDPVALSQQASRLPYGREQVDLYRRAVDAADRLGLDQEAFQARLDLAGSATHSGDPMLGIAMIAWMRARLDAEPERYESFAWRVDWAQKWVPSSAIDYPSVPLDQIRAQIDDLERRHRASGAGPRQALALHMTLDRHVGDLDALRAHYQAWQASERTSLSDCAACECDSRARTLRSLGDDAGALAALEPLMTGEIGYCDAGSAGKLAVAAPLLLAAGQAEAASSAIAAGIRDCSGQPHRIDDLASLLLTMARGGQLADALELAAARLGDLAQAGSPLTDMEARASLAAVFHLAARAGAPTIPLGAGARDAVGLPTDDPAPVSPRAIAELLEAEARRLAGAFDERNGTPAVSGTVDAVLALAPFAPLLALGEPPAGAASRGAGETGPASEPGGGGPAVPTAGEPTAPPQPPPLPPLPDDPESLRTWIGDAFGAWRIDAAEPLRALALDPGADLALRAEALVVVVSDRDPEVLEQAKDVLRRDGISLVLRLRLASTLHEVLMEMGAPDADELGATVAELARSGGDDPLVRRVALLDQVDVARLRHGPAELAQAAQALAADPPLDDARREAVRWRAVLDGLARAIDAGVEADDDLVQHAIAATQALLPADRMTPASRASLLLEAAHLARVVGAQEQALELARSAMAAAGLAALPPGEAPVPVAPDGFALRAWLLLSDVLTPVEGPAAALVAQRSAVEAARRIGAPGAVGWARRGVGHLQQRLERYDEAVVSYAEAARLLLEAGGTVEAAELMVNQARLELELDDLPRARATATSASDLLVGEWVRTDQPGAEEYRRRVLAPLRRDAFELVAIAAGAQDDHMEAVAWWRRSSDADIEAGGRGATYRSSGAEALGRAGDLDGAEAEYVEALLMARPAGQRDDDPNSLWQRGLIRHRRAVTRAEAGNTTGAAADAEVAIESFRSAGVPARAASSGWLLAQILVNGGRAAEAARANAIATQDLDASRDDDPHLRSRLADQRTRIAQALEG